MNIYPIALFLHVSGAIGYFVGMGAWLFGLATMRRAQRVEQVRSLVQLVGLSGPLFGISVLLLLAAGLYMALTAWSLLTGWIMIGLISLARFDLEAARVQFAQLAKDYPKFLPGRLNLAKALELQGKPDQAEPVLRGIIGEQPTNAVALSRFVEFSLKHGNSEAAVQAFGSRLLRLFALICSRNGDSSGRSQ